MNTYKYYTTIRTLHQESPTLAETLRALQGHKPKTNTRIETTHLKLILRTHTPLDPTNERQLRASAARQIAHDLNHLPNTTVLHIAFHNTAPPDNTTQIIGYLYETPTPTPPPNDSPQTPPPIPTPPWCKTCQTNYADPNTSYCADCDPTTPRPQTEP